MKSLWVREENMIKQWWKSKMVWLGILMIIAAALEYIAGLPAETPVIQAISGVLTIIIRFLTNTAVAGGVSPPSVRPPATEKK
jgi:hypothetical protein